MDMYQRLRDLREDRELNQTQIGELLNTTQQQYYKYERGVQEIPLRHMIKLARFYNTSIDYLAGLTNERRPYPRA